MPLAPPTMTSSASRWAVRPARARTARSGAFSGCSRPTKSSTGRSAGRPIARRAPLRSPGAKKACSTAGGTISMRPAGSPYRRRNWRSSSGQLTHTASLQPITSASARSRHVGSRSPPSAFTRASVWNVDTSGHVEGVLQAVADHAAQPVVAVHDVDTGAAAHVVEHAVGECIELVGERLLGQVVRPGRDVHDAVAGLDGDLRRAAPPGAPACTSCTRRLPGPTPRRPRARTRSSPRCRRNPAAATATCAARSSPPSSRRREPYPAGRHSDPAASP